MRVRRDLWLALGLTWLSALCWYAGAMRQELLSTFTRHAEYVSAHEAKCLGIAPGDVPLWSGPDGVRHDGRRLLVNERRCGRV
jgi:hypothetical protein